MNLFKCQHQESDWHVSDIEVWLQDTELCMDSVDTIYHLFLALNSIDLNVNSYGFN